MKRRATRRLYYLIYGPNIVGSPRGRYTYNRYVGYNPDMYFIGAGDLQLWGGSNHAQSHLLQVVF